MNNPKELIRHESQRGYFAYELYRLMENDPNIVVLTGDLGFGQFDAIKRDFPDRFFNVGAAEQSLVGISIGMALEGRISIAYSITPFLLYRPFELIRNYINHEHIPVILVGGGRDKDYTHDGFSHFSEEDRQVMALFSNINSYWPETKEEIPALLGKIIESRKPTYLNLRR